jgi:hypothetical protein
VVQVGTTAEPTSYISATQLSAIVPATQLASGAQLAVAVVNGSVSSGSSTPNYLRVDNPAPIIASVSPTSEVTGAALPVITVTGTGFVPTTVIHVNGSERATTFISSTQVSLALTAADLSVAASLSLTAVNPAPGGGTSATATEAVVASNPTPASPIGRPHNQRLEPTKQVPPTRAMPASMRLRLSQSPSTLTRDTPPSTLTWMHPHRPSFLDGRSPRGAV